MIKDTKKNKSFIVGFVRESCEVIVSPRREIATAAGRAAGCDCRRRLAGCPVPSAAAPCGRDAGCAAPTNQAPYASHTTLISGSDIFYTNS